MQKHDHGDLVRVSAEFRNTAGVLTDPTTISFSFKTPSGVETTYVYGTNAQVGRTSAGLFFVDLQANESGVWVWRFKGTGAVEQSDEGQFFVQPTDFTGTPSAYAEIRERVYGYVNDTPRNFITEDLVDSWIQEGLDDISSRLPMAQDEVNGTTTGTIAIPSDLVSIISLQVGSGYPAWVSNETYQRATDSGVGSIARVFNGRIEVTPVPETTSYMLRYWSMAGDMALVRGNIKVRLVNYAVARVKAKKGDYRASEYFLGLYERGLPAPNNSSINAQQIPDGMTFEFGPFDTVESSHN